MSADISSWIDEGYSEQEARIIIAWLRAERRRLRSVSGSLVGSASQTRNRYRFARNVVQRKRRRFKRYRPKNLPKLVLAARFSPNNLLDGLYPARAKQWIPILKRKFAAEIPEINLENFSFVHDPVRTIESLASIVAGECIYARARLNFMDKECLDIGSYLLLQAIRQQIAPVFVGGTLYRASQKVIDAVGLRKALNMAPFSGMRDHDGVWPFPLQQRGQGRSKSAARQIQPQKKEHVADAFVETVNQWLFEVAKQQLSRDGRRLVLKMIGEALDNAERHSVAGSDDGNWSITGCLSKATVDKKTRYRCQLAFLSLGETICQTILTSPKATLDKIDNYVAQHRKINSEILRTVYSLQDGVTKDPKAFAEGRGGTGFQDILEFFADLGGSQTDGHTAKLAIVSGNTCIHACTPYIAGRRKGGLASERELWFNAQNDPSYPPDIANVFFLPVKLNGTLVTMVIDLDPAYLEVSANAKD